MVIRHKEKKGQNLLQRILIQIYNFAKQNSSVYIKRGRRGCVIILRSTILFQFGKQARNSGSLTRMMITK